MQSGRNRAPGSLKKKDCYNLFERRFSVKPIRSRIKRQTPIYGERPLAVHCIFVHQRANIGWGPEIIITDCFHWETWAAYSQQFIFPMYCFYVHFRKLRKFNKDIRKKNFSKSSFRESIIFNLPVFILPYFSYADGLVNMYLMEMGIWLCITFGAEWLGSIQALEPHRPSSNTGSTTPTWWIKSLKVVLSFTQHYMTVFHICL